jgi:hypothetical protein
VNANTYAALRLTGLTAEQVRTVASTLAGHRESIPTYNNGGSTAPHWAPIVHCEGAFFTVYTPTVPTHVATCITTALDTHT